MRAPWEYLLISTILAACGGDDQASGMTVVTMSSAPGTMTASTSSGGETGPAETADASASTPTSDGSDTTPEQGAPVFLSLQTNVSKITAGESVIFTAVLTDPDGVDDIVGGTLSDETGEIGYGPFVAAGQEGTYSVSLSWDAIQQAETIQFEGMDLGRVFRAEFYDQGAHKVQKDVMLTLTCAEGSACDGVCTDITTNADHCGTCDGVCAGGCDGGQCAPKWGECLIFGSGFETCDLYCASVGEACVENGCEAAGTIRAFNEQTDCRAQESYTTIPEPCATVQPWSVGRLVVQCCCTDTK